MHISIKKNASEHKFMNIIKTQAALMVDPRSRAPLEHLHLFHNNLQVPNSAPLNPFPWFKIVILRLKLFHPRLN